MRSRWNKLKYKYCWEDPIWVYNNEVAIMAVAIAAAILAALTLTAWLSS